MGLRSAILQKSKQFPFVQNWEERRLSPRHHIGAVIQYRTADMTTFENGTLHNLSRKGALISLRRTVNVNAEIHLIVEGDGVNDLPIHIIATVTRKPSNDIDREGYQCACRIRQFSDLN